MGYLVGVREGRKEGRKEGREGGRNDKTNGRTDTINRRIDPSMGSRSMKQMDDFFFEEEDPARLLNLTRPSSPLSGSSQ